MPWGKTLIFCLAWDGWNFRNFWAFCLYWSCPAQNLSTTLWIMPLLQVLKKLWSFIIQVTKLLKQTLDQDPPCGVLWKLDLTGGNRFNIRGREPADSKIESTQILRWCQVLILVTPGNPQWCNWMISKRSIQLWVCLPWGFLFWLSFFFWRFCKR